MAFNWNKTFPREKFLELISTGKTEPEALDIINEEFAACGLDYEFTEVLLTAYQVRNPEFIEELNEAKKRRADVWFNGIANSVAKPVDKDSVPAEKLKFEQRKYLAAIDNPEKYSERKQLGVDVNVNIFQEMKSLKQADVNRLLKEADPFAIEAEFEEVEDGDGE